MKIPLLSRFLPGKKKSEADADPAVGSLDFLDDIPHDEAAPPEQAFSINAVQRDAAPLLDAVSEPPPEESFNLNAVRRDMGDSGSPQDDTLGDPPLADFDDRTSISSDEALPDFEMPDDQPEAGGLAGKRYLVYALVGVLVIALGTGGIYFAAKRGVFEKIADMFRDKTMIAMPMPPMPLPPGEDDIDYDIKMEGPVRVRPPPPPPKPSAVAPPSAETVQGGDHPAIPEDEPEQKPAEKPPEKPKVAEPAKPAEPTPPPVIANTQPPPPMTEPLTPPPGDSLAAPAYAKLPSREDLKALPPAPIPALIRNSERGPLPIIAGGREPRTAYARPYNPQPGKPMIAIVVTGLGLAKDGADAAINKLPPDVSLSFSPYARDIDSWIKSARSRGHETLVDLPLEPPNFPVRDSGPLSLLSGDSPAQAVAKLETILGKTTSYVGISGTLRSPVVSTETWGSVLRALRDRGLLYTGDGIAGVAENLVPAAAEPTLVADDTPFRAAIDVKLARALAAAQRDGFAVVFVTARPVTFERLLAWVATFPQRNAVLVPLSAVVQLRAQ